MSYAKRQLCGSSRRDAAPHAQAAGTAPTLLGCREQERHFPQVRPACNRRASLVRLLLVKRKSRDEEFTAFYVGSRSRLLRALVAVAADLGEAEDALQEAYVRAALRWEKLDAPEAWVRRVAINLVRDSQRRMVSRRRALHRLAHPGDVAAPGTAAVEVVDLLKQLPVEQREALALHYLLDLTVEQVAVDLGRPVGTVKAQLARGRARLAQVAEMQQEATHER
jgi:RNA polymerase sigma-70 factor, ECF subfamily